MADNDDNNADNTKDKDLAPGQRSSASMTSADQAEHEARGDGGQEGTH